jgi:hypothetical protein
MRADERQYVAGTSWHSNAFSLAFMKREGTKANSLINQRARIDLARQGVCSVITDSLKVVAFMCYLTGSAWTCLFM